MFNTKKLIIIGLCALISAFIAQIITQFTPIADFAALLLSSLFALILMQMAQSKKFNAMLSSFSARSKNKKAKVSDKALDTPPSGPDRENGTVKWFDSNKGYGFITRSMGEDIFVHFRSIKGKGYRSLYEGQAVDFIVTNGSKGPQAEDIYVLK